jgi:hypothetical protein
MKERAGRCIHFTGIMNKQCKAGVTYPDGPLPCLRERVVNFPKERRGEVEKLPHSECASYTDPTPEQIEASEREFQDYTDKWSRAMVGVGEWRKAQGWSKKNRVSATGKVPCAGCGNGEIHLSMAALNGHVWGRCTTKGCVSWME